MNTQPAETHCAECGLALGNLVVSNIHGVFCSDGCVDRATERGHALRAAPTAIAWEVQRERVAQNAKWGGAAHDDLHTPAEWVALITRHAGLAVDDGSADSRERFRRQMIRVAALAVAAVETFDRTTPLAGQIYAPREGTEGRGP